ncbi:glycosyltransferase [Flavobacterium gawalongense]|uniref:Glycosyltransferase family 4 protein n=1 Tax=Flavobacterium gawalongense TaxID=2594432 RepID=A0A553BQY3_9FLAO|nr:glycosyltransferase [Flavobacterium gawalongense]TRX00954.1 glycosyltransferase family 4 protein [Flavobacterium gawalongense]TRX05507.1 glycosyltransferase family 4 protein [Flavobacterium gawalongense]TRX10629.1 glycosyltransferase family 4 protein [Flavobacterium gawalongense]TRX11778.1 glycosyltransferase family 4 protein [Flavobacterium gawalongense]TRX29570.1 glycosyltransferase family 4 protein [Flavobacterium gawalongense]
MILPNKKIKIALVGYRLSRGGAEKVMAVLSQFFEKQGVEVHNIIVLDEVSYSYSGKLVNLGKMKNASNGLFNKWNRFVFLKKYLDENEFDFIIDFRFRIKPIQEVLIAKWLYKTKTIFTVHSFLIDHYMPNWSFLTRFIYGNCYKLVSITDESKALIENKHHLKNVVRIYNPIDIDEIAVKGKALNELQYDYIIGVGQMETNIKQFDKLIEAYSESVLPANNIHLVLLGDGERKRILQNVVKERKIEDKVHFLGYQNNPFKYLKKARFFVLSSLNEGLPNVILESLACETPVVAFDCSSGPSEMIQHKENGLLVANQNIEKLSEAMNLFVEDENLYRYCKQNALQSVQSFSVSAIGKQWLDVMKISLD